MATFAAAMMRALAEIDFEAMDIVDNASEYFKLRVGMSAGPVIAGVVGQALFLSTWLGTHASTMSQDVPADNIWDRL